MANYFVRRLVIKLGGIWYKYCYMPSQKLCTCIHVLAVEDNTCNIYRNYSWTHYLGQCVQNWQSRLSPEMEIPPLIRALINYFRSPQLSVSTV